MRNMIYINKSISCVVFNSLLDNIKEIFVLDYVIIT